MNRSQRVFRNLSTHCSCPIQWQRRRALRNPGSKGKQFSSYGDDDRVAHTSILIHGVQKLNDLAAEVREEEERLSAAGVPRDEDTASSTLYGIAVSGAVVALLTLDARRQRSTGDHSVDTPPRTMIILDFSDITLDFWNAIAVALIAMAAREDELARHEFYRAHDLRIAPPSVGVKKRGWELKGRTSAAFDADDDL